MLDNQTILQKADMALADLQTGGGYLQAAQAQRFLRILIDEAVLLKLATVTPMRSPKQLIEKIRFGNRILRAGTESTALAPADRSKPTFSHEELDAQLFKGEVRIPDVVLEDSIERGQLRQTIMQLMAERTATDMDEILVKGDKASTDPFLAKFDGVLKAATSNVYDHQGGTTNRTLFKNMLRTMPTAFLRNKMLLRFLTSVDSDIDYRDSLADRATPNLGDRMIEQDLPAFYSGVPVLGVPLFPDNFGAQTNSTNTLLTDPKNINVGIWRDIKVETDKIIWEGTLVVVITLRFDFKYAERDAVVKAVNVRTVPTA